MTLRTPAIQNKRRRSKLQRARHPLRIPRPEPPARAKECCALASMGWLAFPGRSNPVGLAPMEVWRLVHWVPSGKNRGTPSLFIAVLPAALRRHHHNCIPKRRPAAASFCTQRRMLLRRGENGDTEPFAKPDWLGACFRGRVRWGARATGWDRRYPAGVPARARTGSSLALSIPGQLPNPAQC